MKSEISENRRSQIGMRCAVLGIGLNIILFAGKLFAGILSCSVSIIADAFNNISDAASSIVSLIGFKISSSRADAKHPYGHGRMEYIAAFIVSAIIIVMGFELLRSSIEKIITPQSIEFSPLIIVILAVSVFIKITMFGYNFFFAKKVDSTVLKATSIDSITDAASTAVVLIVTLISHYTGLNLDGWCGILVALLVLWAGISSGKDALDPLLGIIPEKEYFDRIESISKNFNENILGVHDIMVHDYGHGRRIISLHAEVPADGDILKIHDIIDNLEKKLNSELKCISTIHMDPIITNDPESDEIKKNMESIVKDLFKGSSIHDFRMVKGDTHTNLVFDVNIPFSNKLSNKDIKDSVEKTVKEKMGEHYETVINVDHSSYEN